MNKNRKLKDIVEHVPIEDDAVFEAYLSKLYVDDLWNDIIPISVVYIIMKL